MLLTKFQACLFLNTLLYFCLRGEQLLKALLRSLLVFQWQCGQLPRAAWSAGRARRLLQPRQAAEPVAAK